MKITERNISIGEAVIQGGTFRGVGDTFGITGNRAHQITRQLLRCMSNPKLRTEPMPDNCYSSIADVRTHRAFWERQIAALRERDLSFRTTPSFLWAEKLLKKESP